MMILKRCPFCNSKAEHAGAVAKDIWIYAIRCSNDVCIASFKTVPPEVWNTRAISEPKAYMRKWAFDGEKPVKTLNRNRRWDWGKFAFLPLTETQCFADDVPLYDRLEN